VPSRQTGPMADALIVFADIMDSSKYSAVLGYCEYADRLLGFQETFRALGRRYFPEVEDKAVEFCGVDARGDEGIVLVVCPSSKRRDRQAGLVLRAIEFLYHLKGRLKFSAVHAGSEPAPSRFDVGAGIHWGPVVQTVADRDGRSVIDGMEGFAINYAKRVESCSREGRHSRIMLSSEAARCLELEPVLLANIRGVMKGIQDNVELHEVEAGLFDQMELRENDEADEKLVCEMEHLCNAPMTIDAPWVKSLAVSVLEYVCHNAPVAADKARYRQLQYDLAWHSTKEDDPILLYLRSRECRESGQRTRELRYIRSILGKHPHFVHARLQMVKACWALAQGKAEREDRLFAKDTAKEFLDRYGSILKEEERVEFRRLLKSPAPERKQTGQKPRSRKT